MKGKELSRGRGAPPGEKRDLSAPGRRGTPAPETPTTKGPKPETAPPNPQGTGGQTPIPKHGRPSPRRPQRKEPKGPNAKRPKGRPKKAGSPGNTATKHQRPKGRNPKPPRLKIGSQARSPVLGEGGGTIRNWVPSFLFFKLALKKQGVSFVFFDFRRVLVLRKRVPFAKGKARIMGVFLVFPGTVPRFVKGKGKGYPKLGTLSFSRLTDKISVQGSRTGAGSAGKKHFPATPGPKPSRARKESCPAAPRHQTTQRRKRSRPQRGQENVSFPVNFIVPQNRQKGASQNCPRL